VGAGAAGAHGRGDGVKIVELLQSLSDHQVQYVLVGGLAVQLHGFLRATFDIDLVLAMNDENLVRFIDVANSFGLKPGIPVPIDSLRNAEQIDRWHREKGMLAFSLREPQTGGGVVDVLVRPDVTFEKLLANAVDGNLFGRRVSIASIEDLLAMKRIANRPKDQLDITALEKIKRGEDPNA
jgi:predicted nucleotidyltransferase